MHNRWKLIGLALALGLTGITPVSAQVRTIDPNQAIDSDLSSRPPAQTTPPSPSVSRADDDPRGELVPAEPDTGVNAAVASPPPAGQGATPTAAAGTTYQRNDLFSAGERVFGKGAEGLGGILERILKDQGEPNAYIAGREASGAVVVGLRYGSGTLSHRIEGERPVFWTGPSIGFDLGGNASKVFVLVYNLYDTEDLYRRFPEGEGHLYFVGGFSATYLRRGDIVLIPIRLGIGVRAGVNIGYMKFRKKQRWLPF
ncbi:DUF1134 domain-containing protein [Sphingomonas sp. 28-63-12]|uniref:DUF1134 domain-containing protein n=1 Tax=Sphingomonas sp. 28-63-12 TaxID=1970434 RepID=UPI0035A82A94